MAEHTPGPWRPGYIDRTMMGPRMAVRAEKVDGQPYIAVLPEPPVGSQEANASLIAAAPKMLAELRKVEEYLAHSWYQGALAEQPMYRLWLSVQATISEATRTE